MQSNKIIMPIFLLLVGLLTASTVYFFLQSQDKVPTATNTPISNQNLNSNAASNTNLNTNSIIPSPSATPTPASAALTTPAASSNRPSNPSMTYTVKSGETMFIIGQKFDMTWTMLDTVNGMTEEQANKIKEGQILFIPTYEPTTKQLIVSYLTDAPKSQEIQQNALQNSTNPYLDPVKTARSDAAPIFGLRATDDYILKSRDDYEGIATIQATHGDIQYLIDLTQPVQKGKEGIWAISKIHQAQ